MAWGVELAGELAALGALEILGQLDVNCSILGLKMVGGEEGGLDLEGAAG